MTEAQSHEGDISQMRAELDAMRLRIDELEGIVQDLRSKMEKLLTSDEPEKELTAEQRDIFMELDAIKGKDLLAIDQAQTILARLKDQIATKSLTNTLKDFLKSREWGIVSKRGITGMPVWQSAQRSQSSGFLRIQYTIGDRKSKKSESYTVLPAFVLAELKDGRKANAKK